jgi:hypothetical protein
VIARGGNSRRTEKALFWLAKKTCEPEQGLFRALDAPRLSEADKGDIHGFR